MVAAASAAAAGNVVITANTGAIVTASNAWTYSEPSEIQTVSPNHGQYGTKVEITGSSLLGGGSSLALVTLAGVTASDVQVHSPTFVSFRAGLSAATAPGDITLVSDTGAIVTKLNAWTYDLPSNITSVSPANGQEGTIITIQGNTLYGKDANTLYGKDAAAGITSVKVANIPASVLSFSSTRVVVEAANSSIAQTGSVVVEAVSGALTVASNGFQYLTPSVISTVSPNNGRLGTRVTISGLRLRGGGASVSFVSLAGINATISTQTDSQVVVVAGDGLPSVGDVLVITNTGARTLLRDGFSYGNASIIDSIAPTSGQRGTRVTISGRLLRGGGSSVSSVTLAGVPASIQTETDSSVVVLAGASSGAAVGDVVTVSDIGATTTLRNGWTYNVAGSISSVVPSSGQEGTLITISGTNLRGSGTSITRVAICGIAVTSGTRQTHLQSSLPAPVPRANRPAASFSPRTPMPP